MHHTCLRSLGHRHTTQASKCTQHAAAMMRAPAWASAALMLLGLLASAAGQRGAGGPRGMNRPATNAAGNATTHPDDVAAMMELRTLVQSSNWFLPGWSQNPPPDPCGEADCGTWVGLEDQLAYPNGLPRCNWVQIACRGWRVVSISLPCRSNCPWPLSGQLPSGLSRLAALQRLVMSDNKIAGTLPAWSDWTSLRVLDLASNQLSGALPYTWGLMAGVESIDLSRNNIGGGLPSAWGLMGSLQDLNLASNQLTGFVPASWMYLSSVQSLDLQGNCAMCGSVPNMGNTTMQLQGTNLLNNCSAFNCASHFFTNVMIAISVIFGALTLCLVQRHVCWRFRNRRQRRALAQQRVADLEANSRLSSLQHTLSSIPHYQATFDDGPEDPSKQQAASATSPTAQLRSWLSGDKAAQPQQQPLSAVDAKAPTVILMPDGREVVLAQRLSFDGDSAGDAAASRKGAQNGRSKQWSVSGSDGSDARRSGDQDGLVASRVAGAVEDLRQLREQVAAVIAARHARHIAETSARLATVLAPAPHADIRASVVPAGSPTSGPQQQHQQQPEQPHQRGWWGQVSGWSAALGTRRPVQQQAVELQSPSHAPPGATPLAALPADPAIGPSARLQSVNTAPVLPVQQDHNQQPHTA